MVEGRADHGDGSQSDGDKDRHGLPKAGDRNRGLTDDGERAARTDALIGGPGAGGLVVGTVTPAAVVTRARVSGKGGPEMGDAQGQHDAQNRGEEMDGRPGGSHRQTVYHRYPTPG
jgi:hypothetical protein